LAKIFVAVQRNVTFQFQFIVVSKVTRKFRWQNWTRGTFYCHSLMYWRTSKRNWLIDGWIGRLTDCLHVETLSSCSTTISSSIKAKFSCQKAAQFSTFNL